MANHETQIPAPPQAPPFQSGPMPHIPQATTDPARGSAVGAVFLVIGIFVWLATILAVWLSVAVVALMVWGGFAFMSEPTEPSPHHGTIQLLIAIVAAVLAFGVPAAVGALMAKNRKP